MSDIVILRTDEITDDIWGQIKEGYKVCFDLEYEIKLLKEEFSNTITGYSLHALKFTECGKLMCHNYYQPRPYTVHGEKRLFCLSGGTFVLPEFRKDIFLFYDMCKTLEKASKDNGWMAGLSVSNENSFEYAVKINGAKYIDDLSYYILPLKISKILKKGNIKYLNLLSKAFSYLAVKTGIALSNIYNTKEQIKSIRIERSELFMKTRLGAPYYKKVEIGSVTGYYRLYDEDGISTAYIIDFTEKDIKTSKALSKVVNHILKHEKVDAILYVGTMNLKQTSLIKVPRKYNPHKLPLTYVCYDKKDTTLRETLSSMKNIDFSLLNFDVR